MLVERYIDSQYDDLFGEARLPEYTAHSRPYPGYKETIHRSRPGDDALLPSKKTRAKPDVSRQLQRRGYVSIARAIPGISFFLDDHDLQRHTPPTIFLTNFQLNYN